MAVSFIGYIMPIYVDVFKYKKDVGWKFGPIVIFLVDTPFSVLFTPYYNVL